MEEREDVIHASCPLYVCRVCRTKTGWPHQRWCELGEELDPGCQDCGYHEQDRCAHPARRKGGAFGIET